MGLHNAVIRSFIATMTAWYRICWEDFRNGFLVETEYLGMFSLIDGVRLLGTTYPINKRHGRA